VLLLGDNTRARVFYSRVIAFDSSSAEALKAQAALTNLPTPSPPVAAPGPDKTYSPQSANIVKSASVGGTGGDIFDDTSANPNHLPITGFRIVVNLNPADHRQVIIGTLQVQWSGLDGPTHGGRGPLAQPSSPVQFAPSEAIRKVAINSLTFNYPASPPPIWVTGLRIFTNKSSYAFGNMSFGPTTECVVPESKVLRSVPGDRPIFNGTRRFNLDQRKWLELRSQSGGAIAYSCCGQFSRLRAHEQSSPRLSSGARTAKSRSKKLGFRSKSWLVNRRSMMRIIARRINAAADRA
jgi:hypothetical protein